MSFYKKAYLNGKIVPIEEAGVLVSSPTFRYGAAVFEGLGAYWNANQNKKYVLSLEEHCWRLLESMKMVRFEHSYTIETIKSSVLELLKAENHQEDVHILQSAFLEGEGGMTSKSPTGLSVIARGRTRSSGFEDGFSCKISSWTRIADNSMPPRVKCVANYQNGRLAQLEASTDGYDYAILLNQRGKVAEGPGACVMVIRNGTCITPPVTGDILESITRKCLITILEKEMNIPVVEREVDRTELYIADEVLLCGTLYEVTPVVEIDRLPVRDRKPGKITRALQQRYLALARGEDKAYPEWRTEV